MSENLKMPTCYIGDSHILWLKHAVRTGQLPSMPGTEFIGSNGLPLWSPQIIKLPTAQAQDGRFIVGNLRNGNGISPKAAASGQDAVLDKYRGVSALGIDDAADKLVYQMTLDAADRIAEKLGDRGQILFWDLLVREARDRSAGLHCEDGRYRHPVRNMDEVSERYRAVSPNFSVLPSDRTILSLAFDEDCHPSIKGWVFLLHMLDKADLAKTLALIRQLSADIREKLFPSLPDTILMGSSSIIKRLAELRESGALEFPPQWELCIGGDPLEALAGNKIVIDVPRAADGLGSLDRCRTHGNYRLLLWESWAKELIALRKGRYRSQPMSDPGKSYQGMEPHATSAAVSLSSVPHQIAETMLELGDGMEPTQFGVMALALIILNGRVTSHDIARYRSVVWPYLDLSEQLAAQAAK